MRRIIAGIAVIIILLLPAPATGDIGTAVYLPVTLWSACDGYVNGKRGVSPMDTFATETLVPYQEALCLADGFPCFTWAAVPEQEQCAGGETIPMAYAGTANLREHYSRDYDGLMLFANEPDLEGQADLTPTETAALACEIQAYAPGVQLAGPAYSPLGWDNLPAFWDAYADCNGGHDAIVAHVAHIYAVADGPYPAAQLDAFYAALPAGQRGKPVYVHETGFNETATHDPARWWRELDEHEDVLSYGVFTPYLDSDGRFDHWQPLVDHVGRPTALGWTFKSER